MANEFDPKKGLPNEESAAKILNNVMNAIDTEPSQIPIQVFSAYSNYEKHRFIAQKGIVILCVLILLYVPLYFIRPQFTVTKTGEENTIPEYTIDLHNLFPISSVTAEIDGTYFPVEELGNHQFTVHPNKNGDMDIEVTLANGQSRHLLVEVTKVDSAPPELVGSEMKDGLLYLYLTDDVTGVDFENAYALLPDGTNTQPVSFDETAHYLTFRKESDTLNVYIPDMSGNTLHLVLSFN